MAGLKLGLGLRLDRLTSADVGAAAALSAAIGWNQDEADWRRLLDLHPEGAVAARQRGELVGTATLVRYEPVGHGTVAGARALAWLGMVIVSPSARGQGIGSAVMDAALAGWSPPPDGLIGLDATEFGAPLYERRGFETVATIDRWAGTLAVRKSSGAANAAGATAAGASAGAKRKGASAGAPGAGASAGARRPAPWVARRAEPTDLAAIIALDGAETGVDRAALLQHLAAEGSASLLVAERAGELVGYAAVRSGLSHRHVGPLVTRDAAAIGPLLGMVAERTEGRPVFLDSVRGATSDSPFGVFGLKVVRTLQRMTRAAGATDPSSSAPPVIASRTVAAAMGFEWG